MTTISTPGKEYNLYTVTGKVMETGKNMETRIHGSGGGGATYRGYGGTAPISISSTTVVHDQIFLIDDKGQEHSFQLQGFNVACRADNILSVIWAIKKGAKTGPYIAVVNETTGKQFFDDKALQTMFRYPLLYLLGAMVLCVILGSMSSFFYWGLLIVPILWYRQGVTGAKKFKAQTDFKSLSSYSPQLATE
jgi:hypothetical protein